MGYDRTEYIQGIAQERGCYFVAELGQNHQGSLDEAKRMVDSLVGTPVAAIKTAKRDLATCLTPEQAAMPYDGEHSFGRTYGEHRAALELSQLEFAALKRYVEDAGFDFMASYTDFRSLCFLRSIGVEFLKLPSSRLGDGALIEATCAHLREVLVLSTGMSRRYEVGGQIHHIADHFYYVRPHVLQCTSSYPTAVDELDIRVVQYFRERFVGDDAPYPKVGCVGFSCHTPMVTPGILAIAAGAEIIEYHYTLDRNAKGREHALSLTRADLDHFFRDAEEANIMLGSREKRCYPSEHDAINRLRADLIDAAATAPSL